MSWLNRVINVLRPNRLDRELEEELAHHLDLKAKDEQRWGLTEEQSRQAARQAFGSTMRHQEDTRQMDVTLWLDAVLRDVRYALRQLSHSLSFTIVAVLTLALGIGANTAIFGLIHAILLRDLDVANPERLVVLTDPGSAGVAEGTNDGRRALLSHEEFEQLRAGNHVFDAMFASESSTSAVQVSWHGLPAEPMRERLVTADYFSTIGAAPAAGRFFSSAEDKGVGSMPYAVIGHDFWSNRLGSRAEAVGMQLRIQGKPFTIIGIAPPRFRGENAGVQPDLWLPMNMQPLLMAGRNWLRDNPSRMPEKTMWLHAFGRLRPGVTMAQAQAEMDLLFRHVLDASYQSLSQETRKELAGQFLKLETGRKGVSDVRGDAAELLWILMAIVGLVLLIACANMANLLLARAASRRREMSVRLALGAGRTRLVLQLLTESLLLAFCGALCGALLAVASRGALLRLIGAGRFTLELGPAIDAPVLGFTVLLTLVTVLLFGLAPAIRATRVAVGDELKEQGRGTFGPRSALVLTRWLVSGQVGISLLLLLGATLFVRVLGNLNKVPLGYRKERLLVMRVDGLSAGVARKRLSDLYRSLEGRIAAIPGVASVAWSENGLFSGTDSADEIRVEGYTPRKKEDGVSRWDQVGPQYFSTLGIPLRAGREITERDTAGAPLACVVNEAFVRKFIPDGKPLGRHITNLFGETFHPVFEIVGVAADAYDRALRRAVQPRFYISVLQTPDGGPSSIYYEVRTAGEPKAMLNTIRQAIQADHESIQIIRARSLEENIELSTAPERLIANLSAAFGVIALLLAAIGLYGVLSYGIARRTNEIGLRMALGARAGGIVKMVLRESATMLFGGAVGGILLAFWAVRLIESRLFGIAGLDAITIGASLSLLTVVAFGAASIPAWRAARINPVTALRHD